MNTAFCWFTIQVGAIKGAGHIDLYGGVGEEGERYADAMHHYGELWLILPK
jgi:membrane-bound lytic murein transglycosylase A